MLENLNQKRAEYAFSCIQEIVDQNNVTLGKDYRSVVLNSIELIHQCGLLQAFAFYLSKNKDQHNLLLDHIWGYLENGYNNNNNNRERAYRNMLGMSSLQIITYTSDAQKLLIWLKRFAERLKVDSIGTEE